VAHWIIEPGFWSNAPVRTALVVGLLVAISSAVVGVVVVVRAQSFAGHALSDVATAGGAGAAVVGAPTIAGFMIGGVAGAGAMESVGVSRLRGRDLSTGIVLGAATGAAALFFYLAATRGTSASTTQQVLFGSIFTVPSSSVPWTAGVSATIVIVIGVALRPLMLLTVSDQLAAVRGVRIKVTNAVFMTTMAVAVALASVVVGSILSTALLVGPPAIALRLTRTLRSGFVVASLVGAGATWLGILIAYDSYDWSGTGRALPVSFCIVAVIVVTFCVVSFLTRRRSRGTS